MSFESASFVPVNPELDLRQVEHWLLGLPYAFRDRLEPDQFLVVNEPEEVEPAIAARRADPRVFPMGVVVHLYSDRVVVDPHPVAWRAEEVVVFLLSLGTWNVTTEYGPMGVIATLDQLFTL